MYLLTLTCSTEAHAPAKYPSKYPEPYPCELTLWTTRIALILTFFLIFWIFLAPAPYKPAYEPKPSYPAPAYKPSYPKYA